MNTPKEIYIGKQNTQQQVIFGEGKGLYFHKPYDFLTNPVKYHHGDVVKELVVDARFTRLIIEELCETHNLPYPKYTLSKIEEWEKYLEE